MTNIPTGEYIVTAVMLAVFYLLIKLLVKIEEEKNNKKGF
jgi:hypothetical protein